MNHSVDDKYNESTKKRRSLKKSPSFVSVEEERSTGEGLIKPRSTGEGLITRTSLTSSLPVVKEIEVLDENSNLRKQAISEAVEDDNLNFLLSIKIKL